MNSKATNSSRFITTYDEIDNYMRRFLKADNYVVHKNLIIAMADKNKIFRYYKDDLISFAKLRNAIVHNPYRRNANPIAEPHDYIVRKYNDLLQKITKPPKALNTVAIRADKIYSTTLNNSALEVMKTMNKNVFTYVPVLEDGKIIGVFSENTIFSYFVSKEDVILEKEVLIREFIDFIPFDKHESEYFAFVSKDALLIDVEEIFKDGLKDNKRIATVFITETGNEKEKLLGLITAWDLAGYEK